ncbi:hypothetical protein [Allofustis seminis]|uniref:hypothetical protein n=1 Tax=Allofustis seminis TaxID=166939 RepID=UPI000360F6ED|nr:hypothetical protein [Allofustis seminis]
MFNFFKKKTTKDTKEEKLHNLSSAERSAVEEKINNLNNHPEADSPKEQYHYHEQLGLLYLQLDELEEAIDHFERSLAAELKMGDSYKKLLHLYHKKCQESAAVGNDDQIDYYMNKLDELRNLGKKLTFK